MVAKAIFPITFEDAMALLDRKIKILKEEEKRLSAQRKEEEEAQRKQDGERQQEIRQV